MPTYIPNAETTLVTYLNGITQLPAAVSTKLPAKESIVDNGFITVQLVGGLQDPYTFMESALLQVDCWAANANSTKPPWGKAHNLANLIKHYAVREVHATVSATNFYDAYVREILVEQDARRVPGDEGAYARYSMDLRMFWTYDESNL